jgi:MarR family transcriptional regulator, lower aerobic nicotinate degradation pathway regulator
MMKGEPAAAPAASVTGPKRRPARGGDDCELFADEPLMDRVGFLIRRLHQIHVALFMQAAEGADITTIQFTVLSVLHQMKEVDQSELASQVSMDRTNISEVVRRLSARGYIAVRINPEHGRKRRVRLTQAGAAFLKQVDRCAHEANRKTVIGLSAGDRRTLVKILQRLVSKQGAFGQTPVRLR